MKLGWGWTQSPPGIAYHETSVLIPLSAEEVRVTEQPVFKHNFVCQRLVVLVVVCIQSDHSALPCWVWLTTSSFVIAGVIRPRFLPAIRC